MPEFLPKRYPAIFALLAIITGIVLADIFHIGVWVYLSIAIALVPLIFSLFYRQRFYLTGVFGLVCLIMLSASNFAFRYKTFPPGHIVDYVDDDHIHAIYGTIDDWPTIDVQRTDLIVSVDSVETGGVIRNGHGGLLLHISAQTNRLQYGDRIIFESPIYSIKGGRNPSGFNYRRHLNLKGIFATAYLPNQFSLQVDPVSGHHFYRLISDLRRSIINIFQKNLASEPAALAGGFLIGETRDIAPDTYNLFRDSGTLHLLAVSGSNVALILLLFSFILKGSPLGRWAKSAVLIGIIFLFSFLAYNQPSVVRAAVMAVLIILGKTFQRKIDYNNIIAFAAIMILAFEPTQFFDVGFQLSFATAWGLIYFLPKFSTLFSKILAKWYYKFIIWPLLICLAAQIFSLPLSSYYFHRIPLIGFVSNLVIVPLVSVTVMGELILLFTASIIPVASQFVGGILNPLMELTISLIRIFGSSKGQILSGPQLSALSVLLIYTFLLIVGVAIYSKFARWIGLVFLMASASFLMLLGLLKPAYDSRFDIFPVSGGILGFYESTSNQVIISNLPPRDYSYSEKIIIPYLENHQIEKADIMALSPERQTISEVLLLMQAGAVDTVFIPFSSRNLFQDIYTLNNYRFDTSNIVYYGKQYPPLTIEASTLYLDRGQLSYNFDLSSVLFSSDMTAPFFQDSFVTNGLRLNTLILPQLKYSDTILLMKKASQGPQFIICNGVENGLLNWKDSRQFESDSLTPEIINTSEVGVVEIVVRNGKFRISN